MLFLCCKQKSVAGVHVCLFCGCVWSVVDEEPCRGVDRQPKLIDANRRREGRVWCADLLMDVGMWWLACEVFVVQVGALCLERVEEFTFERSQIHR
jgi:hypothetical protein